MDEIRVTREAGAIAVVTIDRPAKRNAVNEAMWRRLRQTFDELGADESVRAVVLTGAGGHFSAGADIGEFADLARDPQRRRAYHRAGDACFAALAGLPKPAIAAISGACVGGGLAFALACDLRIADASARFGIPAARLGVAYSVDECRQLLAVVGLANAKRVLFAGDVFPVEEAARIGLVDRVADGPALAAALAFARTLAENAPLTLHSSKLTLDAIAHGRVAEQAAALAALAERALASEDYKEGARAFIEKRRPRFSGR